MSGQNRTSCFGSVIRARRQHLGKSQGDIARAIEVSSPEFVGMLEAGQRPVPLDRVPALAAALELDSPSLCRLALSERHPVLYRALFGEEASK